MTAELVDTIKSLAGASTADLVGIAPGSEFGAEELGELGAQFGGIEAIIVLAQHIIDPVQMVRFESGRGPRIDTCLADATLLDACWRAVWIIRNAGYKAAIPRGLRYAPSDPLHSVSFKKAGVLAGLGAFGKSQLLIHPQWGPWMRMRAVVTNAPLRADEPVTFRPCDGCSRCIEACPPGALSEDGIDRDVCGGVLGNVEAPAVIRLSALGKVNCEECLRACPVGKAPPRLDL
ncbi:MAG: epoxyqueuosine reductase [Armatimonadota bacterium]|nr:MAG: epoxyqueuosine reductase [Armatimonadota bacterium]